MQQAPTRLSQTIWSAFRAAKPVHRPFQHVHQLRPPPRPLASQRHLGGCRIAGQTRFYSDGKFEVDQKVEDAKKRIDNALESRAEAAAQPEQTLKNPHHETIVHTIPESSSIVHTSTHERQRPPILEPSLESKSQRSSSDKPLPSSLSARYTHLQARFGSFMDNFQTHVFTASRRLNDLTGYSGIEALKTDIETQETHVQQCRQQVKDSRTNYSDAIAMRSTTQREVNDLLHRKHTWSPTDLERFTSLYRSDHANEQTETAAQKSVGDAEQRYEEASTKLAKAILARYHEEQIWSDKIRQMSTWGTWGLMGINVLLFIVFQVVLEPWRRRRLVKGFEEKVELAMKEAHDDGARGASGSLAVSPNQSSIQAVEDMTAGEKVGAVADNIAGSIVDAITGSTADKTLPSVPALSKIEAAAESLLTSELAAEKGTPLTPTPDPDSILSPSRQNSNGTSRWTSPTSSFASYEDSLRALFSDDRHVLVSQRDLTAVAMEGVAGGMALMGLLFVLLRAR